MRCVHGQGISACSQCDKLASTVNESVTKALIAAGVEDAHLVDVLFGIAVGEAIFQKHTREEVVKVAGDYYDTIAESMAKDKVNEILNERGVKQVTPEEHAATARAPLTCGHELPSKERAAALEGQLKAWYAKAVGMQIDAYAGCLECGVEKMLKHPAHKSGGKA